MSQGASGIRVRVGETVSDPQPDDVAVPTWAFPSYSAETLIPKCHTGNTRRQPEPLRPDVRAVYGSPGFPPDRACLSVSSEMSFVSFNNKRAVTLGLQTFSCHRQKQPKVRRHGRSRRNARRQRGHFPVDPSHRLRRLVPVRCRDSRKASHSARPALPWLRHCALRLHG